MYMYNSVFVVNHTKPPISALISRIQFRSSSPKMLRSALFGRKKPPATPFVDFYNTWFDTLSTTLLPQLRRSLSSFSVTPSLLSLQVDSIHHHFQSYYAALDQAAADDVALCLYPDWRNPLERPFLWFADLHPYLFTNLLRSFFDDDPDSPPSSSGDDVVLDYNRPWPVAVAWRSPSKELTARADQIECGMRLMVPALEARARHAQVRMVKGVAGAEWGARGAVAEAVAEEMEELVGVVVDANRLRRSVLADVLSATSVYQAALFLEAVAQFLVGFKDEKLLREFEECDKPIN